MRQLLLLSLTIIATICHGQDFNEYFTDNTMRIDYIFAGDRYRQDIYLDNISKTTRWYGRKENLAETPLRGNGMITVRDSLTERVIYRHPFSTLFQEWLSTEESKHTRKAFENVFLVPFPKRAVTVTVELYDYRDNVTATMTHNVSPDDILIRRAQSNTTYVILQEAEDSTNAIDIAFVAEGYKEEEMDKFRSDAEKAIGALFEHEPFKKMRGRFSIVAVMSPSENSGTSIPSKGKWIETALESHFDTFYSERYLTTLRLKKMHDILAGIPYEHIIVLVNTDNYGGGGIYNSYNLSYTDGKNFLPVVVHEFGHSFGGLADEYEYGTDDPMYFSDIEPWEPNITTKKDFSKKWEQLVKEGKAGLIEGAGYLTKGVYRAFENCRMRTNEEKDFCPVCQQALERMIRFYTEESILQ